MLQFTVFNKFELIFFSQTFIHNFWILPLERIDDDAYHCNYTNRILPLEDEYYL